MTRLHLAISLLISVAASTLSLAATIPYEPRSNLNLLEPWRWREIEPLNEFNITGGIEDSSGNLIFATSSGLVVYDGFSCARHPFPDEFGIETVNQLYLTNDKRVLLYTTSGLFRFDNPRFIELQRFQSHSAESRIFIASNKYGLELVSTPIGLYQIVGDSLTLIPEVTDDLNGIAFDAHNMLWITPPSQQNEIVSYQFDEERIAQPVLRKQYTLPAWNDLASKLVGNANSEDVWAVNWRQGVPPSKFDRSADRWERVDLSSYSGSNNHTGGFHLDDGTLILFQKTAILFQQQGQWRTIDYPEFKIPTNSQFIVIRANGNIVIGGRGESTFEIDYASTRWRSYPGLHFQCETTDKRHWFISLEGGIIENNTVYGTWNRHVDGVIDTPVTIIRTNDDYIWAAGAHQGVPAVSIYNGKEWTLNRHPELSDFISHLSAKQMGNGDILFGSGGDEPTPDNGGIVTYRKTKGKYTHNHYKPPVVPPRIVGIAEYGEDTLWFGGNNLRNTSSELNQSFTEIFDFVSDPWIDHLAKFGSDQLWLTIWDRGLFAFDGEVWQQHSGDSKISGNQVSYLLPDKKRPGNIWIASNRGISRFDGTSWFPMALHEDLRFNRESGTLMQSPDGSIWVNFANRNWYFRKTTNFNITKRLYENFGSIRYTLDTDSPAVTLLPQEIRTTQPANIFVEWTGADRWSNTPSSELRYSYRIGNSEWSAFTKRANTTLLNVGQGSHRFEVRAMDADGNISVSAAAANLVVVPTLWQRPWFVATAVVIILTILFLVSLLYRQRIRHIIQMDEFKLQFFTNISHELRTPLTVILGPLESQLEKLPTNWDRTPLRIAHKNAQKMLRLIDQILDFRSAELGNIKLNETHSDLIQCIRESTQLIKPLADERSQTISLDFPTHQYPAWFDAEIIDKIVSNLLSNAIKYTQPHGEILVRIRLEGDDTRTNLKLSVEDNGPGIPKNKIENIFKIFYRISNPRNTKIRGSGIGLAYTQNLVEACAGKISVESPVTSVDGKSVGARFNVTLPLKPFKDDESNLVLDHLDDSLEESIDQTSPSILIVEDDEDIRSFLVDELSDEYKIFEAEDGEQGILESYTHIPDLILTDIMMPIIDGKELCYQIKSSPTTSHIPVIMLTALKSDDHELQGLEKGADDYIPKPIRINILKQRIRNQFDSRAKLQTRFQSRNGEAQFSLKEVTSNPIDEAFLDKAFKTVETCTQDSMFDVERFAKLMGMSRMTLYRKFKAVTGDSPSEFIRSIRLNKAAELLRSGEFTVSEIADKVGISDLSYFSASFKKRFDQTPSQFQKHG